MWALAECSTRDMKLMAEQKGYRVVSHQHVPEFGLGPNMSLSKNLHTFVREIGHLIKPETDRDSKILARFKLEPPSHLEKRQRARKDVSLRDDEGLIWRFAARSSPSNGGFPFWCLFNTETARVPSKRLAHVISSAHWQEF